LTQITSLRLYTHTLFLPVNSTGPMASPELLLSRCSWLLEYQSKGRKSDWEQPGLEWKHKAWAFPQSALVPANTPKRRYMGLVKHYLHNSWVSALCHGRMEAGKQAAVQDREPRCVQEWQCLLSRLHWFQPWHLQRSMEACFHQEI